MRVVGNVLIDISQSNIFLALFLPPATYHYNCETRLLLAAVSIDGLTHLCLQGPKNVLRF